MRKTVNYLVSKLRRIHRIAGIKLLERAFPDEEDSEPIRRLNYSFFTFQSIEEVTKRYTNGQPMSCFVVDGDNNHVNVAVQSGRNIPMVCFVTFSYDIHQCPKKEWGIHFCQFKQEPGIHTRPIDELNITGSAIMLPYFRLDGELTRLYMQQFTLIYSDWDVLRLDLPIEKKGPACIHDILFNT